MATAVGKICTKALYALGSRTQVDDIDDPSEEAQICKTFIDDTRQSLLTAYPWPFATRRGALQLVANDKRDGWSYVYAWPQDCLATRYIWPSGVGNILWTPIFPANQLMSWANPRTPIPSQRVPYSVEMALPPSNDQVILCDMMAPTLVYTGDILDYTQLSPLFSTALYLGLALDMALAIAIKTDRRQLIEKAFNKAIDLAFAAHMGQQTDDVPPDSEMITGRL